MNMKLCKLVQPSHKDVTRILQDNGPNSTCKQWPLLVVYIMSSLQMPNLAGPVDAYKPQVQMICVFLAATNNANYGITGMVMNRKRT